MRIVIAVLGAMVSLASPNVAWAAEDKCKPIEDVIDSGENENNRIIGSINGDDKAKLKITPDGGETQDLAGQDPAGASGSISGSIVLEGTTYKVTFSWSTNAESKVECVLSYSCSGAVPPTGQSFSTVQSKSGTPATGMVVVVDAIVTKFFDAAPLDTTFSHPEVVVLWRHSGPVSPTDYDVTIVDVDSTSNGDGTSEWVVRYRLDIDPLPGTVHELYSNFHWWNLPPAEDHTFAGSSAVLHKD